MVAILAAEPEASSPELRLTVCGALWVECDGRRREQPLRGMTLEPRHDPREFRRCDDGVKMVVEDDPGVHPQIFVGLAERRDSTRISEGSGVLRFSAPLLEQDRQAGEGVRLAHLVLQILAVGGREQAGIIHEKQERRHGDDRAAPVVVVCSHGAAGAAAVSS